MVSFVSLIAVIVIGIINYLIRRHLALTLTLRDFGFLYSCFSFCMIFSAYLDLGLAQSATILISGSLSEGKLKKANSFYNYFFIIKLLASSIVVCILFLTYRFWLTDFFRYENSLPFLLIIFLIPLQSISSAPLAVGTALKKFSVVNLAIILNIVIVFCLILVGSQGNINYASIAFLAGSFGMLLFLFIAALLWKFAPSFSALKDFSTISPIFHLSKWIAISTAGLSTMYYMDSMCLTYFRGLNAVALYNVILPIVQIAQSLIIISSVFLPIVSDLWINKETQVIADICKLITEAALYLLWPIIIIMILISSLLITVLFSAKFIAASNALVLLFVGVFFFCVASFYMGTLNSGGKAKKVAIIIIFAVIINLLLNFILVPLFSINGAASATALSYIFILFCFYRELANLLGKGVSLLNFKRTSLNGVLGILGIIISIFIVNKTIWDRMLFIIFFLIIYFILTLPFIKSMIIDFRTIWTNKK